MKWTNFKLEIGVAVGAIIASRFAGLTIIGFLPAILLGFLAFRWPTQNRYRFWIIWLIIFAVLAVWFIVFPPEGEANMLLAVALFAGGPALFVLTAAGRWIGGSVRRKKDAFEAELNP